MVHVVTIIAKCLILFALIVCTTGHVALIDPAGRTDNDYLYTFDGSCTGDSCDAFCGDLYGTGPINTLAVGVATTIRWYSRVKHVPHQYRFSLNRQTSDGGFDAADNILTIVNASDAVEAQDADYFSTDVTLPASALEACAGPQPCVLQLYDLYYFVSCANVLLVAASSTDAPVDAVTTIGEPPASTATAATSAVEESSNTTFRFEGASFIDYRVIFDGVSNLDPTIELRRCQQYTFDVYAPGHPLVIKTTPGVGLGNLLEDIEGNEGIEIGVWHVSIPASAPSTLYYQCTLHAEMVGEIRVIDESDGERSLCQEDDGGDGDASVSTTQVIDDEDPGNGTSAAHRMHGWMMFWFVIVKLLLLKM